MMNVTFAQDNILESLIIHTSNEDHLYRTYCTDSTHGRSTTLEKSVYEKSKKSFEPGWEPMAVIDWHPVWILSSLVTYRDTRISINDFLESPSETQWEKFGSFLGFIQKEKRQK